MVTFYSLNVAADTNLIGWFRFAQKQKTEKRDWSRVIRADNSGPVTYRISATKRSLFLGPGWLPSFTPHQATDFIFAQASREHVPRQQKSFSKPSHFKKENKVTNPNCFFQKSSVYNCCCALWRKNNLQKKNFHRFPPKKAFGEKQILLQAVGNNCPVCTVHWFYPRTW